MASLDFYVAKRMQIPLLALREFPNEVLEIWRNDTLQELGKEVATEYLRKFGNEESKS
tara:strand:+ start:573 stop:746 length:174 start_codon:yes stop_codon:yes gene_type:complete